MAPKRTRLRQRREELRPYVSRTEMGKRCGDVDRKTVWRWEAGESDPYDRQHPAIAAGYQWPLDRIDELLIRDGEGPAGRRHDDDVNRRTFLAGSAVRSPPRSSNSSTPPRRQPRLDSAEPCCACSATPIKRSASQRSIASNS